MRDVSSCWATMQCKGKKKYNDNMYRRDSVYFRRPWKTFCESSNGAPMTVIFGEHFFLVLSGRACPRIRLDSNSLSGWRLKALFILCQWVLLGATSSEPTVAAPVFSAYIGLLYHTGSIVTAATRIIFLCWFRQPLWTKTLWATPPGVLRIFIQLACALSVKVNESSKNVFYFPFFFKKKKEKETVF